MYKFYKNICNTLNKWKVTPCQNNYTFNKQNNAEQFKNHNDKTIERNKKIKKNRTLQAYPPHQAIGKELKVQP